MSLLTMVLGGILLFSSLTGIGIRVYEIYKPKKLGPCEHALSTYSRQTLDNMAMEFLQEGSEFTYYFDIEKTKREIEKKIYKELESKITKAEQYAKDTTKDMREVLERNQVLEIALEELDVSDAVKNGAVIESKILKKLQNKEEDITKLAYKVDHIIHFLLTNYSSSSAMSSMNVYGELTRISQELKRIDSNGKIESTRVRTEQEYSRGNIEGRLY